MCRFPLSYLIILEQGTQLREMINERCLGGKEGLGRELKNSRNSDVNHVFTPAKD